MLYNQQRKMIEQEQLKSRKQLNVFRDELQAHFHIDEEIIKKHAELISEM